MQVRYVHSLDGLASQCVIGHWPPLLLMKPFDSFGTLSPLRRSFRLGLRGVSGWWDGAIRAVAGTEAASFFGRARGGYGKHADCSRVKREGRLLFMPLDLHRGGSIDVGR